MLQVKTPDEAGELINREFSLFTDIIEEVSPDKAARRILAEDICAEEYVPDFDRSTVDGYAVRASDTFGCSESIPAILEVSHEVIMGEAADYTLPANCCAAVPTGGALPKGADCAVMLEYTQDYGDGTVGIMKAGVPGMNVIYRGDDAFPGKVLINKGRRLSAHDTGALSAIGMSSIPVVPKLTAGIISTGDELVPFSEKPGPGQIRDVNSGMLEAMFRSYGLEVRNFGIVKDERELLLKTVRDALAECDMVVISGGSSVGTRDAAAYCIETLGEVLLHGIAIKPGKPTIIGRACGKPVIGLPGHPAAAWYIARLFVLPLVDRLTGRIPEKCFVNAVLDENVSANHGRAQVTACTLEIRDGAFHAHPVRSKSGLITQLCESDGFFVIDRDCEGLPKGAVVQVIRHDDI